MQETFLLRNKNVFKKYPNKYRVIFYQKIQYIILWVKTKDRYSKFLGILLEQNYRNNLH